MAAMGGGAFKRTPATLILRDIAVPPDDSLENFTPFVPPSVPDPDAVLVEVKGLPSPLSLSGLVLRQSHPLPSSPPVVTVISPQIPDPEVLLHADCNQQEVMCELSRYSPQGGQRRSGLAHLMVFLDVEGVDFSTVIILQTVETEETGLVQTNLGLPLSQSGTLLTEGEIYPHCTVIFERKYILKSSSFLRSDLPGVCSS